MMREVHDPYRWLEDGDSEATKTWTDAQNAKTAAALGGIPGRAKLHDEVSRLLQLGMVDAPAIRRHANGTRYFHMRREGQQNQPALYVREGHAGADRIVIDVAALSADGTTALDWWYPSRDGSLVAWGKSESGSEESTLCIRDIESGEELADRIPHTTFASLAWLPDGKSFYYSRYPEPGSVPAGDEKYHSKIYLHVIGDDPKNDRLIFGDGLDKTDIPSVALSPNGRWLVVRIHIGWDKSDVFVKDLSRGPDAAFEPLVTGVPALFDPDPKDDRLWLTTNDGASRYRLYAIDYAKLARADWKEILAEAKDVLGSVTVLESELVASYMHDASTRIERFTLDGQPKGPIALPSLGTAEAYGAWFSDEIFVSFMSFTTPPEVYRADLKTGPALTMWDRVGAQFRSPDIEVTQLFATSKDGTKVPMFMIAKKGWQKTGRNPTVISAYGGFNVNATPAFSTRALELVKRGGIYVNPALRGGGEYGEDWHKGGMLDKKQNVFDDLYACAELLIREKVASPETLAVIGGSNGGLLTAVAVTQRPDLWRAALSLVPLTDMLRYHLFRIAKLWIPEYGDPDKAEDFAWLHAYSPYHHVENGTQYPAVLFTTAESDSRVDPMHARKMAARMQEAQAGAAPILLRVETKAGHGAGKPITKLADDLTDQLAFLLRELNVAL